MFQAGWGTSENDNSIVHVPRQFATKSVTDGDCYRKYPVFAKVGSVNSYCAGGEHAGVCDGDSGWQCNWSILKHLNFLILQSGSGFFISVNDTWMLKGIVSASLANQAGECDFKKYAVYSNVTAFSTWIRSIVYWPRSCCLYCHFMCQEGNICPKYIIYKCTTQKFSSLILLRGSSRQTRIL